MQKFGSLNVDNDSLDTLVWIQTSFLGDIVLTTGAAGLAKKRYPNAKHVLITTKLGEAVFSDEGLADQTIVFDKQSRNVVKAFRSVKRQLGYVNPRRSVIIQPHRSARSSLLAMYLGAPVITYRQSSLSFMARHTVERIAPMHEVSRIGLLLEPLGVSREEILKLKPQLPSQAPASQGPRSQLKIGIAPGSVWGTKRWPEEKFAALTKDLIEIYPDAGIQLLGSANERPQADFISAQIASPRVENLAGKTTIKELKHCIANLDLLIANDSSPVHFASAYDVPTVAVFGATVPELGFGPLAGRSKVVETELNCRPCSDHGPQICPLGHFKCMKDVSVASVLSACRGLLGENPLGS